MGKLALASSIVSSSLTEDRAEHMDTDVESVEVLWSLQRSQQTKKQNARNATDLKREKNVSVVVQSIEQWMDQGIIVILLGSIKDSLRLGIMSLEWSQ